MRRRELYLSGRVCNGHLMIPIDSLNTFVKGFDGKMAIVSVKILEEGCSESIRGYYYHSVIPQVRLGMSELGEVMNDERCDTMMRKMSPVCSLCTAGDDGYVTTIREIKDLSNAELCEHIEFVRQFAAENLNIVIDEPSKL